jgi:hypothetical protein
MIQDQTLRLIVIVSARFVGPGYIRGLIENEIRWRACVFLYVRMEINSIFIVPFKDYVYILASGRTRGSQIMVATIREFVVDHRAGPLSIGLIALPSSTWVDNRLHRVRSSL